MNIRCVLLLLFFAFGHLVNARTVGKDLGVRPSNSFENSNTFNSSIADGVVGFGNNFIPPSPPTFNNPGPITICVNGSYYLNPSTINGTFSSNDPLIATVNSSGYVTAGAIIGTTIVSLVATDGGTVTASVTVGSISSITITDISAQPNYKFDNNPHGPIGGTINYVGYKGFTYSSQTRSSNTGYYRASRQDGNEAGCPTEYYIIKCDACSGTVSQYASRPQGTLTGNTITQGQTGQLTYTSSNGGGPFTIIYQPIGGSPVTANNISSTVAFNVATGTQISTTTYNLINVTDQSSSSSADFSGVTATISIVAPPTASLTGSQTICTGTTANLNLTTTGTGSITVTLNDGRIISTISGTTSISVTPTINTTYTLSSVTDISGSGTSTGSSTVNIYAPATITVQPVSNITIMEGATATLSVTAIGEPTLSYQWYKDGTTISGANSDSYTTTNTTSAAGSYYVTVSTICNTVSSTNSVVDLYPSDGSIEFTPTGTAGSPTNNQYLSIPASSNYEFDGDFTAECWVNFKNVSGVYQSFLGQHTSGTPWILQLLPGGQLRLTGAYGSDVFSSTLAINTWYHIALVRSGTSVKIYVNGVNNGSATISSTIGDRTKINTIGAGNVGGNDRFNGFISNVRFVKGVAVYTSNFTPPTSRLTAISGTTLLLNTTNDVRSLKDNSTNNATVTSYDGAATTTGLATSSPLNPFKVVSDGLIVNLDATDASSYPGTGTTWTNLGTGGTTYNATLTNAPTFESGTTANLYFNKPTTGAAQQYGTININTGATSAWTMEVIALVPNNSLWVQGTPFIQIADKQSGNNGLGSYIGVQGTKWNFYSGDNSQGAVIVDNTWKMITVVHSGSDQYIYVNGVLGEVKASTSNSLNEIRPLHLGNPPTNDAAISIQQVKISRFKYYTRVLSASEIGSNLSIQKSRYGF